MTRARSAVALALSLTLLSSPVLAQRRDECVAVFDRAQSLRAQGQLRAARASSVVCAGDSCPAPLRKDCAQGLSGIDTDLPTVVLGARDAAGHDVIPTAVYVDDQPVEAADGRAVAYDPGQHVIRFEHPPDAPVTEHVVLRVGEHNREILATFGTAPPAAAPAPTAPPSSPPPEAPATPPPEKHSTRPTGWIVGLSGVGVLGLGSFAYFAATGYSAKQQLLAAGGCAPACSDEQVNGVRYRYIAADASLGVAVIALGIAAYLLFSSSSDSTASLDPQRFARIFWK
jgi:hypothetical protein